MQIKIGTVEDISQIGKDTFLLKITQHEIAKTIKPGQFCNVKVSESNFPLLRRPFSISDVDGDIISFMIDIVGEGTKILSEKKKGDKIDILGPLGRGFGLDGEFKVVIMVAGGIGLAPFPFVEKYLDGKKETRLYYGARNKENVIDYHFNNKNISTDDGSFGFDGNIVKLLESNLNKFDKENTKFIACGPNPMLSAFKKFCLTNDLCAEVSLESAMACGFGICQGCPVEPTDEGYYKLICKDGPVFNIKDVKI